MRDRTISNKGKLKKHCQMENVGRREDEVALSIMSTAIETYSKHGSSRGSLPEDVSGTERVIPVSYEGMMEMQEAYLYQLYHQLGINSTYLPSFDDGNEKYVAAPTLPSPHDGNKRSPYIPPKPQTYHPPPPKKSLLPKKLLVVFGPESSGTKFLSSTLGVATGAFPSDGKWEHVPSSTKEEWVFHQHNHRRAMSFDGEWEVQHLSLPWGRFCKDAGAINIVKAVVPAECFRYESNPDNSPESVEWIWHSENENKTKAKHNRPWFSETNAAENGHHDGMSDSPEAAADRTAIMERCRNEVHIAEDSTPSTCGAMCGRDQYNGYALYPNRFFVNITSHIEWYISRGVSECSLISELLVVYNASLT